MLGLALWLAACTDPPPPPDLVLVTWDTTRFDAVEGPHAPRWQALAQQGMVFRRARTPVPFTLPSHASILTGQHPDTHGVFDNNQRPLPSSVRTLPSRLREAGYRSAAFVSASVLDPEFGLAAGFARYAAPDGAGPMSGIARLDAPTTVERAQGWILDQPADTPLFVWVHLYDAHLPLSTSHDLAGCCGDPYLDAVSLMDRETGRLLDVVAQVRGRDPYVVIAADHGEGRGDHGELTHGMFLYRSTIHVPLLVAGPDLAPRQVDAPVSLVDIAPTFLALAGVEVDEPLDGQSLLDPVPADRLLWGRTFHPRDAFGLAPLAYADDGSWRMIEAPRPELYDVRRDPDEQTNLAAVEFDKLAQLRSRLPEPPAEGGDPSPIDPELAEALLSLGYVDAVPHPSPDLQDPKDFPTLSEEVDRLVLAHKLLPATITIPAMREFLTSRRDVPTVRQLLAESLGALGEAEEALEVLEPLSGSRATGAGTLRASLLLALGRYDEALAVTTDLYARAPQSARIAAAHAEAVRRAGRIEEAEVVVRRAVATGAVDADLEALRGRIALERRRPEEALEAAQHALELGRVDRSTFALAARALGMLGRYAEALDVVDAARERVGVDAELERVEAKLWLASGQAAGAVPVLERVLAASPDDAEAARLLVFGLLARGDLDAAAAAWSRAAAIDPEHADVVTAAQALRAVGRPVRAAGALGPRPMGATED